MKYKQSNIEKVAEHVNIINNLFMDEATAIRKQKESTDIDFNYAYGEEAYIARFKAVQEAKYLTVKEYDSTNLSIMFNAEYAELNTPDIGDYVEGLK